MSRKAITSMYERLKLSPVGKRKWVLLEDFTYYFNYKNSKRFITVPKGFTFDGASLPKIFYIIGTPMSVDTLIGALCHDYIYSKQLFTRQRCDEIFNEIMSVCEVRTLKRVLYYLGVRIGGWIHRK